MSSVLTLAGLSVTVLSVVEAAAQVQTGILVVKAVDEQGAVIPGVTVSVSSPVLPRELVGVTDTGGIYQLPGLPVGTYTVKTSLQGFQTVVREDVVVRQGQSATIDIGMKVSSLSEEVTVRGESPVVDTKTVGAKVNIDKALLEKTPGGRDIWNIIEYKAPGVVVESPDVGGNQGGLQRSLSARGTPNAQNTQMLNGVNVNDPAAQGFSMNYYVPTTLENIQVSTGAQDIAVGTGGVLINMVTKSGTNRVHGVGAADLPGQGDAVEQRRRRAAAGWAPSGRELDRAAHQHELPGRRAADPEQAVLLRHLQLPGDARQGAELPRRRAVVCRLAAHRYERSGHDRHPRRRRQDHLPARTRATASRASSPSSATTSRTAAPTRRLTQDSDSKELDTFVIVAARLQLACSATACSSTARSATTTRTSRCSRRPICSR